MLVRYGFRDCFPLDINNEARAEFAIRALRFSTSRERDTGGNVSFSRRVSWFRASVYGLHEISRATEKIHQYGRASP